MTAARHGFGQNGFSGSNAIYYLWKSRITLPWGFWAGGARSAEVLPGPAESRASRGFEALKRSAEAPDPWRSAETGALKRLGIR